MSCQTVAAVSMALAFSAVVVSLICWVIVLAFYAAWLSMRKEVRICRMHIARYES